MEVSTIHAQTVSTGKTVEKVTVFKHETSEVSTRVCRFKVVGHSRSYRNLLITLSFKRNVIFVGCVPSVDGLIRYIEDSTVTETIRASSEWGASKSSISCPMVEPTTRNLLKEASLISGKVSDVEWQDKLKSIGGKGGIDGKSPDCKNEEEGDNQEDDGPHDADEDESTISPQSYEIDERKLSGDKLQRLQEENSSLVQRLAQMETQHAQRVDILEAKLQQAIENHKEIELRLRSQLQTVLREQQAAAENAHKVRTILTRVSNWVRQVQRSAQAERSLHTVKPVDHELEVRITPRSDSHYTLWSSGAKFATNVSECHESPTNTSKFTLGKNSMQWSVPDSYSMQIEDPSEPQASSLPPPAPGRNRVKNIPGKGFNYVGYCVPSPSSRPEVDKPVGGPEIVLDGLPSVFSGSHKDTPVPKRIAGSLLSYCAQVVTTSLAGVRSFPSPPAKVTPAWIIDRLAPLREELEVDEEAGECTPRPSRRNVGLPSLSIGLL